MDVKSIVVEIAATFHYDRIEPWVKKYWLGIGEHITSISFLKPLKQE
jgi:hypothetical protein